MPGAGTIPRCAWPLAVSAGTNQIYLDEAPYGTKGPWIMSLTPYDYSWVGRTGSGSPVGYTRPPYYAQDWMAQLYALLNLLPATGNAWDLSLASNGVLTITADAFDFRLYLAHANTTISPAWLGFTPATHTSAARVLTGSMQVSNLWLPEQVYIRDSERQPGHAMAFNTSMTERSRGYRWTRNRYRRTLLADCLPGRKIYTAEEVLAQEAFERFYEHLGAGGRFEFTRDWLTNDLPDGTYQIREQSWMEEWPVRMIRVTRLYNIEFPLKVYVP